MWRVESTATTVTSISGSTRDAMLWERHFSEPSLFLLTFHLYVERRHEIVLLKQLMGTQSLLNFTTRGTVSEDDGMWWESSESGMGGSKHIIHLHYIIHDGTGVTGWSELFTGRFRLLYLVTQWSDGEIVTEQLDGMGRLVETWNEECLKLFVAQIPSFNNRTNLAEKPSKSPLLTAAETYNSIDTVEWNLRLDENVEVEEGVLAVEENESGLYWFIIHLQPGP